MHFTRLGMGLAAALFCLEARASFDMSPIIATVAPSGGAASISFTLTNADDTRTPVQIGIFHREPDVDGKEKYVESKDIGEMFQIYPAQVILGPKEKRTVRVTYVGDPKIKSEMAFRIIAEEFPINVTDPEKFKHKAVASIQIASKYVGSLYVTPASAKSDVQVEVTPNPVAGGNQMIMQISNKGTTHELLKKPKFKFYPITTNKEIVVEAEDLPGVGGQNILAGKTRKFVMKWPKQVPVGSAKVTVEVSK